MSTKLGTPIADFETQLATQIDPGDTGGTLQSYTDDDSVALPNGKYFFTLDIGNSYKEHIVCDLTAGVMSNIKSVSRQGVQTTGAARKHRIGASVTITDWAHIKYMNDLLAGTTLFNSSVKLGYDGDPGLTSGDLYYFATVDYVNDTAIAGAPNASALVKGISFLSVAPNSPTAPIAVGDNDPRMPTQDQTNAMDAASTPSTTNPFLTNNDSSVSAQAGKLAKYNADGELDFNKITLPAFEALTAGDFLKVIKDNADSTVKLAKIFGLGAVTSGFSGSTIAFIDAIKLSSTKIAVYYTDTSSPNINSNVIVGTISGQTMTFGSAVTLTTENTSSSPRTTYANIGLTRVSDTCFAVLQTYNTPNNTKTGVNLYVCTVSSNTITAGSANTMGLTVTDTGGSNSYPMYDIASPADGSIVIAGTDTSNTDAIAVAATINESTRVATPGSALIVNTTNDSTLRVHILSSNRMFFSYSSTYRVVTLSGTTLTSVATNTLTGAGSGFRFVKGATNNEGLCVLASGSSSAGKLVESSGTITISLTKAITDGISSILHSLQCYDPQAGIWLLKANTASKYTLITLGSTEISQTTATNVNGNSGQIAIVYDQQKFVEISTSGSSFYYTVGALDWQDVIAVANASVSAAASATASGNGDKDLDRTNLIPGIPYYLNVAGAITQSPTTTVNTISFTNKYLGKAFGTTSLKLNL